MNGLGMYYMMYDGTVWITEIFSMMLLSYRAAARMITLECSGSLQAMLKLRDVCALWNKSYTLLL